jgi:hypothetical protein
MGHGGSIGKIVNGNNFYIWVLKGSSENQPAYSTKSIYPDLNAHRSSLWVE